MSARQSPVWIVIAVGFAVLVGAVRGADEATKPWRSDAGFQRLAQALGEVRAIDNHAHLLGPNKFDPSRNTQMPLLLRQENPDVAAVLKEQLGLEWDPLHPVESDAEGRRRRTARIAAAGGEPAYWVQQLDLSRTEIALINQASADGIDGRRMRWVPYASTLLVPLAPERLGERNPASAASARASHARLLELLKAAGHDGVPGALEAYVEFVGQQLARWKQAGAVAVKFRDAYDRTLRFEEVPAARAAALWSQGRQAPLARDDYLALQDYLAGEIFRRAGPAGLAVHVHSSHGAGPFLRLYESDVRNLENVLADPRFAKTNFVLIHGGAPWHEAAAYLAANKPNVYIDASAMPFLYPVPELAQVLRKYLTFAPERTLFGTDTMSYFGTPVGTEFVHLALTRNLREALSLSLAGLVRDGVVTEPQALAIGKGFLAENARALYKF
jgi:predicted TIM-barrel fold metal-dependent hydrolase